MAQLLRAAQWQKTFVLLVIIALAAGLRFWDLGQESLWGDELFSLELARAQSLSEILKRTAADVHPPAYYLLLRSWTLFFSPTIISVRAFSAFVSLLTIPFFFLITRRFVRPWVALLATAHLAISPYHVWYAQEGRMYSLLVFLEVVVALTALRIREDILKTGGASKANVLVLCISTVLMAETHFFYVFMLPWIAFVWIQALWSKSHSLSKRDLLPFGIWIVFTVMPGLLALPQVIGHAGEAVSWIPALSWNTFVGIYFAYVYGPFIALSSAWNLLPAGLAMLVLLASSLRFIRPTSSQGFVSAGLAFAWLFSTLGLQLLVSLIKPIVYYGQRYEIIATLPFYLLLVIGFDSLLRTQRGRWCAGICMLLVSTTWMVYLEDLFDSRQKRTYDTAAQLIDAEAPTEPVGNLLCMTPSYTVGCVLYYLKSDVQVIESFPSAEGELRELTAGKALWVVSVVEQLETPSSHQGQPFLRHERTTILELSDVPGMLLRVSKYRVVSEESNSL